MERCHDSIGRVHPRRCITSLSEDTLLRAASAPLRPGLQDDPPAVHRGAVGAACQIEMPLLEPMRAFSGRMRDYYSGSRSAYIRLSEPGPVHGVPDALPVFGSQRYSTLLRASWPPRPGRAARTKWRRPSPPCRVWPAGFIGLHKSKRCTGRLRRPWLTRCYLAAGLSETLLRWFPCLYRFKASGLIAISAAWSIGGLRPLRLYTGRLGSSSCLPRPLQAKKSKSPVGLAPEGRGLLKLSSSAVPCYRHPRRCCLVASHGVHMPSVH